MEDFSGNTVPSENEIQIHTWFDATLRELADCIQKEVEEARRKDNELNFSFIYPDKNGKFRRKDAGRIIIGKKGQDDMKTLY